MPDDVALMGLDFGTTTSSAVVASARIVRSPATGRMEIAQFEERFRSEMIFTPLDERDRLDMPALEAALDVWMTAAGVRAEELFGGGALLTGLTAQRDNAKALVRLVRGRLGSALVATADDPCLESWLAFMGSAAGHSRSHPTLPVLNLDIGGGTTNLALGLAGQVLRTGCIFVGARHVRVVPGTYRILGLSRYAAALFAEAGIARGPGDDLTDDEVRMIVDAQVKMLEAAAAGSDDLESNALGQLHVQIPFRLPEELREAVRQSRTGTPARPLDQQRDGQECPSYDVGGPQSGLAITFSGGVGELIYAHLLGEPWPSTTRYGDLGVDLARRIVASCLFAPHLANHRPASAGRATVYGLLRHSTEASGNTLHLPRPGVLPLTDVPIIASLDASSTDERLREAVDLVRRSAKGGCLGLTIGSHDAAAVRTMGMRIAAAIESADLPDDRPLVLLVRENVGKVLGQYVTRWGALAMNLLVIDEVSLRDAQYVQVGAPRNQVVPVSFYGLNASS